MTRWLHPLRHHWRGDLPILWTLAGPIAGVTLLTLWLARSVPSATPLRWVVFAALAVVLFWQVIGTARASRLTLRSGADRPLGVLGYGAAGLVLALGLVMLVEIGTPPAPPPPPGTAGHASVTRTGATLHLQGEIELRSYYALERALTRPPAITRLTLDSPGGAVHAARGIARLVREAGLDTHVTGRCHSACPLILIAGRNRSADPAARIGFHSYATPGYANTGPLVLDDAAASQRRDAAAFRAQGVSEAFIARMFDAAHDTLWLPDHATLRASGVLTR
ncbi:hypothetical protein [Pseudaestuariivita atlantica]|uniref:COG3904 family protein n=1 Tax=Pseudaestuariivita atlantica TaxID=1317121 RepID=UPI00067E5253|nr:hypothetical protein [Pseudaestuariivita atlantica]